MTVQSIAQALFDAAAAMQANGDSRHAKQVDELSSKLTEGRLTVALCGHFSAGKSTLINTLCGAKLLPSSPIPTSANVVSISGGQEAVALVETIKNGNKSSAKVAIEELDRYCKDGETYTSVEIQYPSSVLGKNITLLDTPGVDSTDDAHRLATESALHLADVVLYVMDYNHVQSEINFAFAKQLKDWGKPLYFIVNQIDKHRETEISFETYRQSVSDAFHAWHLEPAGILYLSLRQPEHPYHQWVQLLDLLRDLTDIREQLCIYSVTASLRYVAGEHIKWMESEQLAQKERFIELAGGEEAVVEVKGQLQAINSRIKELTQEPELKRVQLRLQLQSILDNANIIPANLRDLAHTFLDSRKPGFKSGFLFSGAKTQAEQTKRLSAFKTELDRLIEAGIQWHMKEFLRKEASSIKTLQDHIEQRLEQLFNWTPDGQWLIDKVNSRAVFGNEYTMIYSKEISEAIKSRFRQLASEFIDETAAALQSQNSEIVKSMEQELRDLQEKSGAVTKLEQLDAHIEQAEQRIGAVMPKQGMSPALPIVQQAAPIQQDSIEAVLEEASVSMQLASGTLNLSAVHDKKGGDGKSLASGQALGAQREAGQKLYKVAAMLEQHTALAHAAKAIREKAGRLAESQFTIALFGAFSAGKSSLANALIGEFVLPVSPNPTTASINRLLPPNEDYPHRTARVFMKSEHELLEDLKYSLALLGEETEQISSIEDILAAASKLKPESIAAGGRAHYSFLRAAKAGWEEHRALLGGHVHADQTEYEKFVAIESRSCFVRSIDYHYHCPLTAEGIILVDTPGADSVNARHTDVAFNYIKNADAVLFVTYYNHAFSQADRQFLQQLGRVKDQFELDKMFFIVNASDLANDYEELEGVLKHVENNLLQHEIRFPRLFPISSLQALQAKQNNDDRLLERSGMQQFEREFLTFVQEDLGALAVQAAELELSRVKETVSSWLSGAQGDAGKRAEELMKLQAAQSQSVSIMEQFVQTAVPEQLKQDIKELHFYILQRAQFRFGDFYNYSFNPASLQDDGRDLRKGIWTSWLELERILQLELEQELQATSLRVEKNMQKYAKEAYNKFADLLEAMVLAFQAPVVEFSGLEAPKPKEAFKASGMDAKRLWSKFKSPRSFFEGNGKELLRSELEQLLHPQLKAWMDGETIVWDERFCTSWKNVLEQLQKTVQFHLDEHIKGMSESLQSSDQVEKWTKLYEELTSL